MKPRNKTVAMTIFSIPSEKMHRGLTGHSGPRNAGFSREAISLVRAATFLLLHDRLEVPDRNSPARRRCVDRELIRDRRGGGTASQQNLASDRNSGASRAITVRRAIFRGRSIVALAQSREFGSGDRLVEVDRRPALLRNESGKLPALEVDDLAHVTPPWCHCRTPATTRIRPF